MYEFIILELFFFIILVLAIKRPSNVKVADSELPNTSDEDKAIIDQFDLVLNNIAAAVMISTTEGKPSFVSSYIQVLTGYAPEQFKEAEGDFIESIIIEEDLERYQRNKNLSKLGEDSIVRFRIRHRSGLILWLESRLVPTLSLSAEVESVLSIIIDVTETINYQTQIEQQNQDLSDFAYMVSHDLKAPVFTIQGMADAIKEDHGEALGEEGLQLLQFISNAADRLHRLVGSVIEYSSLNNSSESPESVCLSETMGQVVSDYAQQIKSSGAEIIYPEDLPSVKGEAIRIYQILSNLIGNTIKYRDTDRTLRVEVSAKLVPPRMVELVVRDNGLGIPEGKLEDIFRPYRRAHGGDIEGSGIGLACVKKIVNRLGGRVYAESVEGEGSSFHVLMPAKEVSRAPIPEDLKRLF
jgi:PAS domain S-box-containing protein